MPTQNAMSVAQSNNYVREWTKHRSDYKKYLNGSVTFISIFNLFDEFGVENCKIEWVEDYPCSSKKELHKKEGEHQKNCDCVNKLIAGRSKKEHYNDNREEIRTKQTEQYINNKEYYRKKANKYNNQNKDKIKVKNNKKYIQNKAFRLKKQKDYYNNTLMKSRKRKSNIVPNIVKNLVKRERNLEITTWKGLKNMINDIMISIEKRK